MTRASHGAPAQAGRLRFEALRALLYHEGRRRFNLAFGGFLDLGSCLLALAVFVAVSSGAAAATPLAGLLVIAVLVRSVADTGRACEIHAGFARSHARLMDETMPSPAPTCAIRPDGASRRRSSP